MAGYHVVLATLFIYFSLVKGCLNLSESEMFTGDKLERIILFGHQYCYRPTNYQKSVGASIVQLVTRQNHNNSQSFGRHYE